MARAAADEPRPRPRLRYGTRRRRAFALLAAGLLAVAVACSGEAPEQRPATRGPAVHDTGRPEPGPYPVRTRHVSTAEAKGAFRGGTLHYPADERDGGGDESGQDGKGHDHGVIAASPGLGAEESVVTPYGKLLASYGFVVITINTKTLDDSPSRRGHELLDALGYVTGRSPLADRTDPDRLGVLGHSMGGGGALFAASRDRNIKAAVGLTPYAERRDWPRVRAATLLIGGSGDEIAPVKQHAAAFYEGLDHAEEKEYLELRGDHFVATPPGRLVGAQVVGWFRHFLDGGDGKDDRQSSPDGGSGSGSGSGARAPLCPPPHSALVTASRDTCPFDRPGRTGDR
ncbi:alpha/beta hydrolase [Streptomyces sp. Amel2xB2]|uniref:poly(ethylene terephthalate) hydrolase family protein n=1 Tax=Streptomyces sp. Amel2xB2 TaxID=1305829 RepID=UPI0011B942A4|nr:alpha/beta hydrolase [Streptomyces sp. Amel2xB2]